MGRASPAGCVSQDSQEAVVQQGAISAEVHQARSQEPADKT